MVVVVEMETGLGLVWEKCCWSWEGVGEMLMLGVALASAVNSVLGELMVVSVLCSSRHVMEGLVRPCWRFMIMARQMGVFWTMWLMVVGEVMTDGWMGMSRMMRTWDMA